MENFWPNDFHAEMQHAFYEDAQPIELPELTWRDAETLSDAGREQDIAAPVEEPEPETAEERATREAKERAQRIRKAERAYDNTRQDATVRNRKRLNAAMDAELESGKVVYLDRHRVAFQKVSEQYTSLLHRSGLKVQKYEDVGSAKKPLVNRVDFIVDFESVARRALKDSPQLLCVFLNQMASEFSVWEEVPAAVRIPIEYRCGWWFTRAGLHPSHYWN